MPKRLPSPTRLRNIEVALVQLHHRLRRLEKAHAREKRHRGDYIGFRVEPQE